MPFDLSQIGATSQSYRHTYGWRQQATYALGIGAKKSELRYLYESVAGGMQVFPTYAVVPAFEAVIELLTRAKTNFAMVVHGAQKIRAFRAAPSEGTLETVGTLRGIYDLKKLASLIITTETSHAGEPLFATEWNILVRGEGGFDGERPPKDEEAVSAPRDRDADWTVEHETSPEQALLYRISGDTNPLHADPEFAAAVGFAQGPLLHGLATYGHVARAAIEKTAGGNAIALVGMGAQFRNPVWPGDTIVTSGWNIGEGKVALVAHVKGRPDPVVTSAWATFTS
ncbi:MAG: MaoC family protein [Myxococcales bacterium]|nr:MaoC family protein [Myxococcales bacterium]